VNGKNMLLVQTILYSSLCFLIAKGYVTRVGHLNITPLKMVVDTTPFIADKRKLLLISSDIKEKIEFKVETSAILNV